MSYFFGDGFDLYASVNDLYLGYWDSTPSQPASITLGAGRFAGSRSLGSPSSTSICLCKTSGQNDAVHHFTFGFIQTIDQTSSGNWWALQLADGTTNQCCVVFNRNGNILLTSATPGGTVLATYTAAAVPYNVWYAFEIEVVIHPTAGSFAVRKNGNTVNDFFASGLNTRPGANSYANRLNMLSGATLGGSNQFMDDFLWRSDPTTVPWVGDVRCYTRLPASDASVQWNDSGPITYTPYSNFSQDSLAPNWAVYSQITPVYSGTIGSVRLPFTGSTFPSSGAVKCAIYANSTNVPVGVLGAAPEVSIPVGGATSVTFTFTPPVAVTAGTTYWVAFAFNTTCTTIRGGANVAKWTSGISYAAFPQTNPPGLPGSFSNAMYHNYYLTVDFNWQMVSEAQQDSAISYVYSSAAGQSDFYTISAIGATPSTILGVTTRAFMQKSDAGTGIAAVQIKSGGTTLQTNMVLNTVWGWATRTDLVDPDTGAAWTAVGVNNAQIGVASIA